MVAEYKRIIDEEPGNAEAHYSLAYIYEKQGMIDAALSSYEMASFIDPENDMAKSAVRRLRTKSKQTI